MSYNEQEAHIEQLLLKKHLGEISPEELLQLETLLKTSEDAVHQLKYLETTSPDSMADLQSIEVNKRWGAFQDQLSKVTPMPTTTRRWIRPYSIVAAAAVLGVVLLALNFFYFQRQQPASKGQSATKSSGASTNHVVLHIAGGQQVILNQTGRQDIKAGDAQLVAENNTLELTAVNGTDNAWNTLEVPPKLDYKVNLPDGSIVHLNAATKLKFPFSFKNPTREVFVEGEAYFTIVKKANEPFIVHTPNGDIQVLGTEFNINTYTEGVLKTALVNGGVKVTDHNKSIVLKPGEYLTITKDQQSLTTLDSKSILSWRNGIYYFRNIPFKEIAAMITRWFDVKVVIDNTGLNDMPFTGQLNKSEPLEVFLKPMQYTSDINYYYKDNVLHINK